MDTTARAPRDANRAPRRRGASQMGMTWPPAMPFGEVLRRARSSENRAVAEDALTLLYRRFLPVVYRFILSRVADIPTAEDLTSETFFAIVERIAETRAHDELTFAAWTLGIARNQVATHFRRQRSRPTTRLTEPEEDHLLAEADGGDPLHVITAREAWSEVVTALNQLTEDQRNVLLYRVILGYSAEDVGTLLNKQAGAVRGLQFRALASLARILGAQAPGRVEGEHGWKGDDRE
ncbi:MAG TPA: sigma-70 family RNA polymerase sigma factor [Ktedonobacterales bacterium]